MKPTTGAQRIVPDCPGNDAACPCPGLGLRPMLVAASPAMVHRNLPVRAGLAGPTA